MWVFGCVLGIWVMLLVRGGGEDFVNVFLFGVLIVVCLFLVGEVMVRS